MRHVFGHVIRTERLTADDPTKYLSKRVNSKSPIVNDNSSLVDSQYIKAEITENMLGPDHFQETSVSGETPSSNDREDFGGLAYYNTPPRVSKPLPAHFDEAVARLRRGAARRVHNREVEKLCEFRNYDPIVQYTLTGCSHQDEPLQIKKFILATEKRFKKKVRTYRRPYESTELEDTYIDDAVVISTLAPQNEKSTFIWSSGLRCSDTAHWFSASPDSDRRLSNQESRRVDRRLARFTQKPPISRESSLSCTESTLWRTTHVPSKLLTPRPDSSKVERNIKPSAYAREGYEQCQTGMIMNENPTESYVGFMDRRQSSLAAVIGKAVRRSTVDGMFKSPSRSINPPSIASESLKRREDSSLSSGVGRRVSSEKHRQLFLKYGSDMK
jgi:hypothetical protein